MLPPGSRCPCHQRGERRILIAHENCRWYLDWPSGAGETDVREREAEDLRRARELLAERFANSKVELYYARLEEGEGAFEPV